MKNALRGTGIPKCSRHSNIIKGDNMSSMSIYASEKALPYVYICTHKESGHFYIGYRCANKLPSHLDLPKYKTSSKVVRPKFDEFEWKILAEFFSKTDAYIFEQQLIAENWKNSHILNKHYQTETGILWLNGPHSPETLEKLRSLKWVHSIKTGEFIKVSSSTAEELVSSGEYNWGLGEAFVSYNTSIHTKGKAKAVLVATGENLGLVDITDPRWQTKEIKFNEGNIKIVECEICGKHFQSNKISQHVRDHLLGKRKKYFDCNGKECMLHTSDQKVISGEFKQRKEWGENTNIRKQADHDKCACSVCGEIVSARFKHLYHEENCGVKSECLYCGKMIHPRYINKYHNDNCKHKPK
jgi:hypothetical protein